MAAPERTPRSATRLFLVYAAVSAVPVVLLGFLLAGTYRIEAARRGLDEGRSESALVATTSVEPLLAGSTAADVAKGLAPQTRSALQRVASNAVARQVVARLRLRDLAGHVVYSQDGSGLT